MNMPSKPKKGKFGPFNPNDFGVKRSGKTEVLYTYAMNHACEKNIAFQQVYSMLKEFSSKYPINELSIQLQEDVYDGDRYARSTRKLELKVVRTTPISPKQFQEIHQECAANRDAYQKAVIDYDEKMAKYHIYSAEKATNRVKAAKAAREEKAKRLAEIEKRKANG